MPMIAAFTAAEIAAAAEAAAIAEAAATAAAVAEAAAAAEAAATTAAAAEAASAASVAPNAGILGAEIGANVAPAIETTAANSGLLQVPQNLSSVPLETLDASQLSEIQQAATNAQNMAQNAPVTEQLAYNNTSPNVLDSVSAPPVEPVPETFAELQAESAKNLNPPRETWSELQANRAADPNAYRGEVSDRMLKGDGFDLTGGIKARIPQGDGFNLAGDVKAGGDLGMTGNFPPAPAESGFMKGVSSALDWADKNPFKSSVGAYAVAKKTGMLDEDQPEKESYDGILSKYKMSPDFKGRQADPQDYQYTPKVYNMASGGIASYRSGGDLSRQLDYYEKMTQTKAAPAGRGDAGIVFDTDPDTRSLDPVTAAQVRMAKVNKRANMQLPSVKRPTPMGQLNLVPVTMKKSEESSNTVDAAQGGVIHSKRYADGGITGQGGLQLNIPLDIGGSGGGSYGGGGGGTYPFQNNGGFAGNNNAPQDVPQEVIDQYNAARSGRPYQTPQIQQTTPPLGLGAPQGTYPSSEVDPQGRLSPLQRMNLATDDSFGRGFGAPQGPLLAGGSMGQFPYAAGGPRPEGFGGLLGEKTMAGGGITSLGGYAAGGNPRLLRGPGDGMSDNIPATIAGKQPARLADGEFVIPADVVSHLGNGSTEAGAKKLHKMMNDVRKARTGNPKQGKQINPNKFMPK